MKMSIHCSIIDSSHLRKAEAKCTYSKFSEKLTAYMALTKEEF